MSPSGCLDGVECKKIHIALSNPLGALTRLDVVRRSSSLHKEILTTFVRDIHRPSPVFTNLLESHSSAVGRAEVVCPVLGISRQRDKSSFMSLGSRNGSSNSHGIG
jgi:hypothetical protein